MRCLNPIRIEGRPSASCGKCLPCLINRQKQWAFRLMAEHRCSESSWFLTLTYEDENLPMSPDGIPVVCKRDVQLFLKRLRKSIFPEKIRYFICAEYGTKTLRPHYHAIIFGLKFNKQNVYETILSSWKNGFITISPLTHGRAFYCAKYCCSYSVLPEYYNRREYKPFLLSSRRPGIGFGWLTSSVRESYRLNPRRFIKQQGGYKLAMPRYYSDKLFDDEMKEAMSDDAYINTYNQIVDNYEKFCENPVKSIDLSLQETEGQLAFVERKKSQIIKNSKL